MNPGIIVLALCCISAAHSTYQSSHKIMLQSVPDLSSYSKTYYPQQNIQELGEYSEGEHTPEVIKVIKTLEVKVPVPFPIKVPHKVPYPVAFKVPHIVKVPQIVKIAHAVPVEVVKHVQVPAQQSNHGQSESFGIQQSYGGGGFVGGAYGAGSYGGNSGYGSSGQDDSGSHSQGGSHDGGNFQSYGGSQQSAWQGVPAASYGAPAASYGAPAVAYGAPSASYGTPQHDFGGSAHGSEQSNAVNSYQQEQYSTIDQSGYGEQAEGEQSNQGGDHSAQASQASSAMLHHDQNAGYNHVKNYEVNDPQQAMDNH